MNSEKVFSCPFFNPLGFKLLSRIHTSPLAQACSLCPIQNSQFSPRPTRPPIQNSKFTIQNRCKGKIFCLYCQDVVPLHLEVTEKIGIIK